MYSDSKQFIQDILLAFASIRIKWFHSLLGILGVVIAVASIIIMISVSEGTKQKILKTIEDMGINTIRIYSKELQNRSNGTQNLSFGITQKDYEALNSIVTNGMVSHTIEHKRVEISYKHKSFSADLYSVDRNFLFVEQVDLVKGRLFLEEEMQNSANVVVVAEEIAKRYHMTLNSEVLYNDQVYSIIGIVRTPQHRSNALFIPIEYSARQYDDTQYSSIDIYLFDNDAVITTAQKIRALLKKLHHGVENYRVVVPLEMMEKRAEAQNDLTIMILIVALMSILSGGVSIMNIMLSNITEQTREIGLKRALGATKGRIVVSVLIHTMILMFFALIFGTLVAYILVTALDLWSSIAIVYSFKAFFMATLLCVVAGILFGLYPALKASEISPMNALREF